MAERKAVNKYYPPDWTPDKGSINSYVGQHPLRDRARKLGQGILIVRFEMPFNIWCGGCNSHIAMGVRYNAEKKKVGKYLSTTIFNFRMKCHLCENYIEVQTDPKNAEYLVVAGGRRKIETYDAEDNETLKMKDEKEATLLAENPLYRLEHEVADVKKAESSAASLQELMTLSDSHWKNDYANVKLLKQKFRVEKKEAQKRSQETDKLKKRSGLLLPILDPSEEDAAAASAVPFRSSNEKALLESRKRLLKVKSESVFPSTKNAATIDAAVRYREMGIYLKQSSIEKSGPSSDPQTNLSSTIKPKITGLSLLSANYSHAEEKDQG